MTLEGLQEICMALPATTEDIKWECHLCFSVGGKMYLITGADEVPVTASFKVSDEDFEALCAQEGFIAAPYMAKNKWVKVDDISRLSRKQWKQYLQQAHEIIAAKLTKKLRKELGLLPA
jgi:predicted DNA-binding protein (MmcQ/YjbR family)